MTPILAFDIETIPDCAGIRRLHELPADLSDRDVAEVAFQKRRAQSGGASDFLPLYLQRVVAISCVLRERRRPARASRSASPTPARPPRSSASSTA